jgi:hypothetical protein
MWIAVAVAVLVQLDMTPRLRQQLHRSTKDNLAWVTTSIPQQQAFHRATR